MILGNKNSQVRGLLRCKNAVIIDLKSQACRSSLINLSASLFSILANLARDLCCLHSHRHTHAIASQAF